MEERVLCGANSYKQQYYFNPRYQNLPEFVQRELKIMCITFTEEAGGILILKFDTLGNLLFQVEIDDGDYLFDEIESGIQISRFQRKKEELLKQVELYYRVQFLGQRVDEIRF